MNSNFSQRTFLISFVILLTIGASIFRLEHWAAKNFRPITFNPKIKHIIEKDKPDIICIGNSMLGSNIEKMEFEKALSAQFGRPIHASFIVGRGLHTAWHYLVLKNQIAPSAQPGTPLLFFDYEDYYIRPEANTLATGRSEVQYRESMQQEEPLFRSKIGTNAFYFASGSPYLYSQRFQIKKYLLSNFLIQTLKATGVTNSINDRMYKPKDQESLARLIGSVFRGSAFRGGQADDRERNDRIMISGLSDEDFEKMAEKSFLPDLLSYKDKFPMTFILSSSNPSMTLIKSSIGLHSTRLQKAIETRGGTFIDMNKVPEVQSLGLMHDSRHFTKGKGRNTNTDAVVGELVKSHALDSLIQGTASKP